MSEAALPKTMTENGHNENIIIETVAIPFVESNSGSLSIPIAIL